MSRGDWLSGRALRSHRRGHWFEPSIAHCHVGPGSPRGNPPFSLSASRTRPAAAPARYRPGRGRGHRRLGRADLHLPRAVTRRQRRRPVQRGPGRPGGGPGVDGRRAGRGVVRAKDAPRAATSGHQGRRHRRAALTRALGRPVRLVATPADGTGWRRCISSPGRPSTAPRATSRRAVRPTTRGRTCCSPGGGRRAFLGRPRPSRVGGAVLEVPGRRALPRGVRRRPPARCGARG